MTQQQTSLDTNPSPWAQTPTATTAIRNPGRGAAPPAGRDPDAPICVVPWTDALEMAVLDVVADTANLSLACDAVGIRRQRVYDRMRDDEGFRERVEAARQVGIEHCIDVARERAIRGYDTTKIRRDGDGNVIWEDTTHQYNDSLLQFILKGDRPGTYKDTVSVQLDQEGTIQSRLEAARIRRAAALAGVAPAVSCAVAAALPGGPCDEAIGEGGTSHSRDSGAEAGGIKETEQPSTPPPGPQNYTDAECLENFEPPPDEVLNLDTL